MQAHLKKRITARLEGAVQAHFTEETQAIIALHTEHRSLALALDRVLRAADGHAVPESLHAALEAARPVLAQCLE